MHYDLRNFKIFLVLDISNIKTKQDQSWTISKSLSSLLSKTRYSATKEETLK